MFFRTVSTEVARPTDRRLKMSDSKTQSRTVKAGLDLEAISERYFAAWAGRDPDAIVALHTEDTQFWSHLGMAPVKGRDAVRDTFADLFERFPEFDFET